ncbi:hypothetical protein RclHR1_15600010 [Rhizophagus clarus]|uniref:SAM domain-containing protein n=1 Tax=Rhizophagus clarus TaxID=94130 RepID=A0A2Z6R8E8_9GLOM|nr:hypothetical protein RclHR1_15600010 [Rhizophagus clarus]
MSSETSTPYTPASTSTTGNEAVTLADEIKKYNTTELIDFLRREEDLGLSEKALEILETQEVNGRAFLKTSKEEFQGLSLGFRPAKNLADFAKEFSHHIDEKNPAFKFCIEDILRRIKNMGPVIDSNEAMRCEYISTILHTAVSILEGLVILPQMEVSSDDSSGCVDYAIKRIIDNLLEEIICITEGKQNLPGIGVAQNLIQCKSSCEMNLDTLKKKRTADEAFEDTEGIYCTSKTEYRISLTEVALKDSTDLRKNVKRILEVIVGLLKDRVSASEEFANKKRRVEEMIKKKIIV